MTLGRAVKSTVGGIGSTSDDGRSPTGNVYSKYLPAPSILTNQRASFYDSHLMVLTNLHDLS